MRKMLFISPQSKVNIVLLPNKKYDVTVLDNEETVVIKDEEMGEETREDERVKETTYYQYDGNSFRTVYKITEEEVLGDMEKWLNYSSIDEPTVEELEHDNELIDKLTLELIEGGIL